MKVLVTGGCGFIGSHVVDWLLDRDYEVVVLDNLSTGRAEFLKLDHPNLKLYRGDCMDLAAVTNAMRGCQQVFHLQANADVRGGRDNTGRDMDQNVKTTWNVLEAMRMQKNPVESIAFASSAVVYGEPDVFPTPETYSGQQTSLYGATKLACESMIQAYAAYFGFGYNIFRFVSWIGEHYTHGVIFDFVKQLTQTSNYLEVLGDGLQEKSYLYVADGVAAVMAVPYGPSARGIYNIGHDESVAVRELAHVVIDEMGSGEVSISFGNTRRGWIGDAPVVRLDTSRLKVTGWKPQVSIADGIRRTVRFLKANPHLLKRA